MSKYTSTKLSDVIELARKSNYNQDNKAKLKTLGRGYLKELASKLELPAGSFDLRFNPGGIAVSGDSILHGEWVYVCVNDFGCYWRFVKGRKDYTGEVNRGVSPHCTGRDFAETIKAQRK